MSAGRVKIAPEAIEEPAEAPVATMLFSRMLVLPNRGRRAIEITAAGMAVATVKPTNKPTYALADARITVRITERMMALSVNCRAGTALGAGPELIARRPSIFSSAGSRPGALRPRPAKNTRCAGTGRASRRHYWHRTRRRSIPPPDCRATWR